MTAVDVADNDARMQGTTVLPFAPPIAAHLLLKGLSKCLETSTLAMYGIASIATGLYLLDDGRRATV